MGVRPIAYLSRPALAQNGQEFAFILSTRKEGFHGMSKALQSDALNQLFVTARTHREWTDAPVEESVLRALYDLLKWGPTSANCCPARFVWVRTQQGKSRLASLAMDSNRTKILAAPVTVIIGNDLDFPDTLPRLFPARGEMLRQKFLREGGVEVTAMRNATLQGAYLIVAARALGLDCGPMSGFDNAGVDRAFFAGKHIQSNFICSLGHGKADQTYARSPRLDFDDAGWFA
jgi:3-hydroxypropanoate dehydrogenase